MCSRALRGVGLLTAFALLVPPATAQAQDPRLPAAERDRLEAELRQAEARVEALEERRRAALAAELNRANLIQREHISVTVGPIELRGTRNLVEPGAPAARAALREFAHVIEGLPDLPRLELEIFDRVQFRAIDTEEVPAGGRRLLVEHDRPGSQIRRAIHDHVLASLPDPIAAWSAGWGWDRGYDPSVGLRSIVRSTDPEGVACLQGNAMDACSRFLFLEYDGSLETRRDALERLYPRPRIERVLARDPGTGSTDPFIGCLLRERRRGSADPAGICVDEISDRAALTLSLLPATPAARASILSYALSRDPGGGMTRLTALPDGASVGDQLAAIADMPADRLVAAWQDDASLGTGLFQGAGNDRPGTASLFWAGGLALLALRSTRWRLG